MQGCAIMAAPGNVTRTSKAASVRAKHPFPSVQCSQRQPAGQHTRATRHPSTAPQHTLHMSAMQRTTAHGVRHGGLDTQVLTRSSHTTKSGKQLQPAPSPARTPPAHPCSGRRCSAGAPWPADLQVSGANGTMRAKCRQGERGPASRADQPTACCCTGGGRGDGELCHAQLENPGKRSFKPCKG